MSGWNNYDVNTMGGYGGGGYGGMGMGAVMPVAPMNNCCPPYGGYGGGGGFFSGATGGAFGGALVGSLVGDLFGGGLGNCGKGCGHSGGPDTVVQVNENGGIGHGHGGGQWAVMEELSDCRREIAVQPYMYQSTVLQQTIANNAQIAALQMQICQCCNEDQKIMLEGQYKALLTAAGISKDIAECCCKELDAIKCMGYETQLRDQSNYGNVMKEMGEIKCLIKDTEKDSIIRYLTEKNNAYEGKLNVEEIKNAMKPPCPVPAYITCSPYENVLPTVKVARDCDCRCDDNRWSFNNCHH